MIANYLKSYGFLRWMLLVATVRAICFGQINPAGNPAGNEQLTNSSASLITHLSPDSEQIIIKETIDSFAMKKTNTYRQWEGVTHSCDILVQPAIAKGYNASPEKVSGRLTCYTKAFPGIRIDSGLVANAIILENYLWAEFGITPSAQKAWESYQNFAKEYPSNPPSPGDVLTIFNNMVLFTTDTVVQMCNEQRQQQPQDADERTIEKMKPWDYREIALKADEHLCVVKSSDIPKCLVSVKEFNDYLQLNRMEHDMRLDVARETALRGLLTDLFYYDESKKTNVAAQEDLVNSQEIWLENKFLSGEYPILSENFNDEGLLRSTYEKYYDRFFKAKIRKTVGIIGSTDSLRIDSLYRNLRKIETDTTLASKKARIDSLPWLFVTSTDLPDTIISVIDTLKLQQSHTFKTPFGFFLCRVLINKRKRAITFAEAQGKLVYIILSEKARSRGKPDSVLALEYYRNHPKMFKTPDTVITRTWLVPLIDTSAFQAMDKKTQQKIISGDTTAFRPIIIGSNDLPAAIADSLLYKVKETKNIKSLIGPVSSRLGTWYFAVQKVITGGKKMTFVSVREKIIKEIEIQSFPFDSIMQTEAVAHVKRQAALAGAYRYTMHQKIKNAALDLSDEEVKKLIENKIIKVSYSKEGPVDARLIGIARSKIRENLTRQRQEDLDKWLTSLIIDRELLFAGCSNH